GNGSPTMRSMFPPLVGLKSFYEVKNLSGLIYNPMTACLTSLLQIPVFLAFYQAISRHPLIKDAAVAEFFSINLGSIRLFKTTY
ncbi:MAG: hypothetical protein Q3980_13855, partial [Turicibacter sp.]|nr:hypothetical protein [Turicibacter sp.]